jgi:hypothetical protein
MVVPDYEDGRPGLESAGWAAAGQQSRPGGVCCSIAVGLGFSWGVTDQVWDKAWKPWDRCDVHSARMDGGPGLAAADFAFR